MSEELPLDVSKKKKKGLFITIIGIVLVLAIGGSAYGYHYHTVQVEKQAEIQATKVKAEKEADKKKQAELQYVKNINEVVFDITNAGAKTNDITNTYQKVWHDAIWDHIYTSSDGQIQIVSDFNTAISYQRAAYEKAGTISELQNEMSTINKLMIQLKEPPSKYKGLYSEVVDLYSTLTNFEKMAENPSGSLNSYSSDIDNLDNDLSKKINSIKVQLPN
jgi:hypothetical protein